jgi:type IV/VI secretion system ImpK/VasF family protein
MDEQALITTNKQSLPKAKADKQAANAPLSNKSLVGLAGKLFSILGELKKTNKAHDPRNLRPYLIEQIQVFAKAAKESGHNEETILIGQFILSQSFDAVIATTSWGQQSRWQSLVSALPHSQSLQKNFPLAMQKMCQMPSVFIDILELIYICLNLSESKQTDPKLSSLNQELYHVIQSERSEFEKRLSRKKPRPNDNNKKVKKTSFWPFAISTVIIVGGIYFGFNYLLNQSSAPLAQQLSSFSQGTTTHAQPTQP